MLDGLVDDLGERDRRAVLLRFIERRSFAEVGLALRLSENAARMRVERALDKLRAMLRRRGILSTSTALAAALGEQAVVAAPAGLATQATAAALTAATGSGAGGYLASHLFITMNTNKVIIGTVALLAASAGVGIAELHARARMTRLTGENQRLERLLSHAAGREIVLKARAMEHPTSASLAGLGRHVREEMFGAATGQQPADAGSATYRNAGQADPHATIETFAWASDRGDTGTLAKTILFGGNGRQKAQAVLAALPPEVQSQFSSPEELYALFIADDALTHPPPPESVLETLTEENTGPDQATLTLPGSPWHQNFQNTPEGWKYVFPENGVDEFARTILDAPPPPPPGAKGT